VETRAVSGGHTDPAAWAEVSCRIVASDGFCPAGRWLESDYLQRWGLVIEGQLAAATRRVAESITGALELTR
jgi:hypothetical protein